MLMIRERSRRINPLPVLSLIRYNDSALLDLPVTLETPSAPIYSAREIMAGIRTALSLLHYHDPIAGVYRRVTGDNGYSGVTLGGRSAVTNTWYNVKTTPAGELWCRPADHTAMYVSSFTAPDANINLACTVGGDPANTFICNTSLVNTIQIGYDPALIATFFPLAPGEKLRVDWCGDYIYMKGVVGDTAAFWWNRAN